MAADWRMGWRGGTEESGGGETGPSRESGSGPEPASTVPSHREAWELRQVQLPQEDERGQRSSPGSLS